MQVLFRGITVQSTCKIIRNLTYALFKGNRRISLDFRGSLMSGLRSSPKRDDSRQFGGGARAPFQNSGSYLSLPSHTMYIISLFTITAEIHARSLANFYGQYPDRHMNLRFMRRVREREGAIRQFVILKNKLISVCNASVLLLTMNFVITLSK